MTPTGSGHIRLTNPDGRTAVLPSSPSHGRAVKNARADLRRAGLKI